LGENNWFANRFEEHRALFEGRGLSDARLLDRRSVLINGTAGAVITVRGRTLSLMGFIVAGRKIIKIIKIDTITDPGHVGKIPEAVLGLNEALRLRAPN
jgi:hypothetical protein